MRDSLKGRRLREHFNGKWPQKSHLALEYLKTFNSVFVVILPYRFFPSGIRCVFWLKLTLEFTLQAFKELKKDVSLGISPIISTARNVLCCESFYKENSQLFVASAHKFTYYIFPLAAGLFARNLRADMPAKYLLKWKIAMVNSLAVQPFILETREVAKEFILVKKILISLPIQE